MVCAQVREPSDAAWHRRLRPTSSPSSWWERAWYLGSPPGAWERLGRRFRGVQKYCMHETSENDLFCTNRSQHEPPEQLDAGVWWRALVLMLVYATCRHALRWFRHAVRWFRPFGIRLSSSKLWLLALAGASVSAVVVPPRPARAPLPRPPHTLIRELSSRSSLHRFRPSVSATHQRRIALL